jgi:hypothetical protein
VADSGDSVVVGPVMFPSFTEELLGCVGETDPAALLMSDALRSARSLCEDHGVSDRSLTQRGKINIRHEFPFLAASSPERPSSAGRLA